MPEYIGQKEPGEASSRAIAAELEAQEALRKAKEEAELVFQLVPSAIYTVDPGKRVLSWNKRAEELTGYKASEVIGRSCGLFAVTPCRSRCGVFDPAVKKPVTCVECTIRAKDGTILTIAKNADVIKNEKGEVVGGIESFEDVTGRKLTEKA